MKYEKNPAIEEIREVRKKIFNEFNRDTHLLGKHLMEMDSKRKKTSKRRTRIVQRATHV